MTKAANRARSVICTVVSFLLALLLTVTTLSCVLSATALNPAFAIRVLARSNYAEQLAEELHAEFVSFGNACNIDESFFDGVFETDITAETIDADSAQQLRNFYAGNSARAADATASLQAALSARLQTYAVEKGFSLDAAVVKDLDNIASELCTLYDAYAAVFSASYFQTASRMLAQYTPYAWYAAAAGAVGILLCAGILRLYFQKKQNYLRFFIYALSGATLMIAVAPVAALLLGVGRNINITLPSLYSFASWMINGVLGAMALSAAVPGILCVLPVAIRHKALRAKKTTAAATAEPSV